MAIQSRLTSAAAAWNKSQRTKRMTAATMSRWITFVGPPVFGVSPFEISSYRRVGGSTHFGFDTLDRIGEVITNKAKQRLDGGGQLSDSSATRLQG